MGRKSRADQVADSFTSQHWPGFASTAARASVRLNKPAQSGGRPLVSTPVMVSPTGPLFAIDVTNVITRPSTYGHTRVCWVTPTPVLTASLVGLWPGMPVNVSLLPDAAGCIHIATKT